MSIGTIINERDKHLPIGAGLIDHQTAFKALKNINYDSTITLKVFTNCNDVKSSADKLRMSWANEYYIPSRSTDEL
jgi:L-ribulose-5-phosphate 3-epimerase UlaE